MDYLREENVGFPSAMIQDTIQKHVMIMVSTLWYIDGNAHKILGHHTSTLEQTQELNEPLQRYGLHIDAIFVECNFGFMSRLTSKPLNLIKHLQYHIYIKIALI